MVKIRVWAPHADQLELFSQGQRRRMQQVEEGKWILETTFIEPGADYGFFIDGEGPFPDPCSPSQPQGVHGLSRFIDHAAHAWKDAGWQPPPLKSALFYELHIGTFTPDGTFDAAIARLDHLTALGITHVELMPIAEFSGSRGWGYDGVALYAPHHDYGGPEGLKRFVEASHQKGLAVLLDVVYNHLGPVGNYLGRFGPYFTDRYSTPWGEAVNLDGPHSDQVRRYFIDNALMWLSDYHIDGLRLDAVHALVDTSAIHFLEQLKVEVEELEKKVKRPFILIAESDLNDPRLIRPIELGGYGMHAQWNEDFHHALHAFLTHERTRYYQDFGTLSELAKSVSDGFVYDGCYSAYRRRKHGRSANADSPIHFVGYLQNHDQIGNRALGERTSALLSEDTLKMGAAFVLTSPYLPLLFQGEEWGASSPFLYFTDHAEPKLGEAVYQGRKKEFADFALTEQIPHPQSETTYLQSKLRWEEMSQPPHNRILAWHRSLIDLRKRMLALQEGSFEKPVVEFDELQRWLIVKHKTFIAIYNFAETSQTILCKHRSHYSFCLCSKEGSVLQKDFVTLPAHSVLIQANW